ncbi:MAG: hypothetical protein ACFKPT_24685 [Gloeotrichia echinulata GP01]
MIEILDKLERPSACGLAALIFIAKREQTSVAYQHKKWNFSEIPHHIIDYINGLEDEEHLAIAQQLVNGLIEALPGDIQLYTRHFTGILPIKNS